MAITELFSLVGRISAAGIDTTKKELTAIDKEARRVRTQFNKLGKSAQKLGKDMTKFITVPLLAAGVAATVFGADFESAMSSSLAIMSDVSNEMRDTMEKTARDVAKSTKFSATQAAESFFFLASAGLSAADSIGALPRVAAFAQAGMFDMALATDLLTDAQSALGLVTKDSVQDLINMARVSDVLVGANTLANASVQQFSEALTNKAGASLRLLGKDIEEGVAALAVFADQGNKGQAAGNDLARVFRNLSTNAIKNKKAFKEAGIAVFDQAGEMRNLADIVVDLETRFKGMSDEQLKAEIIALGFNDKTTESIAALIGTSEKMKEYEKRLRSMGGITDEVANKQLQNFNAQMGLVKDRLIDVALTVFDILEPALTGVLIPALNKVVGFLSKVADGFQALSDPMSESILIIAGIALALGPVIFLLGKLVLVIPVLINLYKAWALGQLSLNVAMTANPIGVVIVAIAALIAITVLIVKNWKPIAKFFTRLWGDVTFIFQDSIAFINRTINTWVGGLLKSLQVVAAMVPGLSKVIEKASEGIVKAIEKEREATKIRNELRQNTLALRQAEDDLANAKEAVVEATEKQIKSGGALSDELDKQKERAKALTDAQKRIIEERERIEEAAIERRNKQLFDELTLLAIQEQEEIAAAEAVGANTNAIVQFFSNERIRIFEEEERKKKAIKDKADEDQAKADELSFQQKIARIQKVTDFVFNAANQVLAIVNQGHANKLATIDIELERDIAAAEANITNEEELQEKTLALEAAAQEKKNAILRKQFKTEKTAKILNIIGSTATAVMKAFSQLGPILGIIPAAIMAGLGITQAAIVGKQPNPYQEGGIIPGSNFVGDRVIARVNSGEMILNRAQQAQLFDIARGGGGGGQAAMAGTNITIQAGTIVAGEFSVKEFTRKIRTSLNLEQKRRGAN